LRVEYQGAAYPVMARRNHGKAIFADDLDRWNGVSRES